MIKSGTSDRLPYPSSSDDSDRKFLENVMLKAIQSGLTAEQIEALAQSLEEGEGSQHSNTKITQLSDNARIILEKRYLKKDDQGNPVEEPDDLFRRVSKSIAQGEPTAELRTEWERRFYDLTSSLDFLPNSPTLVNAGRGLGCLSACFVVSPEDTMDSIMKVAYDAAMIEKWGGGIGFGFSNLRPKSDKISTTHGEACGPIAVMKLYSSIGATLTQGSFRLGAHMGQLRISHPDVREFIHCKDRDDTLQNFNISLQITDDFMKAVESDEEWQLINPRNGNVVDRLPAKEIWSEICESAWKTGDPGVVFIDRVWETAPNPQMGLIETSNPCGEEFLENYGNCCLGSINLDHHIDMNGIDWIKLEQTIRTSVRFLDDVIETNRFPLPKLREVNLATRRIGLGVMGWADALVRLSIPYDSQEALALADEVGQFINDTAWNASADLAKERGPFPEYSKSGLKERGMPPVRNSSVITIAPTGTISRLAECSSGIEPHFALAWWSNVLWKDHEGTATRLLDAPVSVKDTLRTYLDSEEKVTAILELIASNPLDAINILKENGADSAAFRTSMSISPEAHVRMQAVWQKHVTNSVSKTINLPNDATVADIHNAYWLAWETGCKAVTVYRDGSKSMQVLETGKELANNSNEKNNRLLVPRQRPTTIKGITERSRTGQGTMYVTINFDEEGKPFELFSQIGKAGGTEAAHLEGLSRMISLCLRSSIAPHEIVSQLKGITSEPIWDQGVLIRSAEDAVAQVLSRHIDNPAPKQLLDNQITSDESASQLGLFPSNGNGTGLSTQIPTGSKCTKCSGYVIHQEGCLRCLDCGYTKCE